MTAFIIHCPQTFSNTMEKLAMFYSVSSKIIASFSLPNKAQVATDTSRKESNSQEVTNLLLNGRYDINKSKLRDAHFPLRRTNGKFRPKLCF